MPFMGEATSLVAASESSGLSIVVGGEGAMKKTGVAAAVALTLARRFGVSVEVSCEVSSDAEKQGTVSQVTEKLKAENDVIHTSPISGLACCWPV